MRINVKKVKGNFEFIPLYFITEKKGKRKKERSVTINSFLHSARTKCWLENLPKKMGFLE